MWYFWNYHASNPGHDHILTIFKTKSIIEYDVLGIGRRVQAYNLNHEV